ncbi:sensor histidine kinase [Roseateles saccharophilus]|uniref:Histidine kinase/DNA gyrase B/HSP90-like ATPase n=1 Tax=Roseateles saccharophilus TaxID=304 RepID=A0A4R3VJH6_ROSSA|nr:histidine kinase [Roseateles saccharophilus]MDG0832526.1 sensor histidine kinase [Roseateles saccharophilus]TCV03988.1 histidine kinase/DNA gyrase B/HSP90-like ATPase [Roseateles saccharophilus]
MLALRKALPPALLFWAAWALLRWQWPNARWPTVAAQLWLAYSAAWLVLPWRWWPLGVLLAAAGGAWLGVALWPPPIPSLFDTLRAALPAFAFALLMHLPLRWWRWREEQAVALRLAQAEQAAAMAELSRQVSVSELKALQAQVEPHFLFNALASLQQLIRSQPATAERFLGELHDYLRLALPSMREPLSTVERELALARAYLTVMGTRLGARLQVHVQAQPGCEADAVPPMMLLTLVENAVRHGIEPLPRGGCIDVQALREAGRLVLEVRDSGAGLQPGSATAGQGVGLANVRDRLASLYAGEARLILQQRDEGGVSARIELPAPS